MDFLFNIIDVFIVLVPILLGVAFITLLERKAMGSMQRRLGPNIVGYFGLLQPIADALKLIVNESILPFSSNAVLFYIGPAVTLICALLGWAVIPFGYGLTTCDLDIGVIYSIAISSLGVYGILIAGWSSNSKYSFIGTIRSSAQLISYELILSSAIILVIFLNGSFNYSEIISNQKVIYNIVPLFPVFIIFIICALAETNRAPFDLPEAESELVAGFMTEYSAVVFVFFFLAEYSNIILISSLSSIFFLGGFDIPEILVVIKSYTLDFFIINGLFTGLILGVKTGLIIFIFILVRASFPRIRYDQLINFCWLQLLPLVFALIVFFPSIMIAFDIL
jgi:NADH-ubiquinone oxidoreductase chain 1